MSAPYPTGLLDAVADALAGLPVSSPSAEIAYAAIAAVDAWRAANAPAQRDGYHELIAMIEEYER